MPERDYVCDRLKVGFDGVLSLDDLYRMIRKWFSLYKYTFSEIDHKNIKGEKKIFLKLRGSRKVSDYIKNYIELEITAKNVNELIEKKTKKKMYRCEVECVATGYLLKDYEETWTKEPLLKFLRDAYDRFVAGSKLRGYEKELLGEVNKLLNEIKAFFELQRV